MTAATSQVYTGGLTPEENSRFLDDLISKVSPAYALFREGGAKAGRLVDLIVAEKLSVPEGFAQRGGIGEGALAAWGASAEGARPYRNAMQLVVDHFPGWWQQALGSGAEGALAEHLPRLAPAVGDLGDAGVRDLIEVGEAALATAAEYALADAHAVQAIQAIAKAGRADASRCAALLRQLPEVFPLKMIEDSRDAERFLPALGRAVKVAGEGWGEAVELALALVRNDASSAYGVLEAVPKALAQAPDKQAYLAAFAQLAGALGNRVSGLCLKKLPAAGPQVATETAELAQRYGVLAAERFLERSL